MTIRAEAFLDLEQALVKRLIQGWDKQALVLLPRIYAALKGGNKALAVDLANQVDLYPILQRNREYFRYFGYAALLFGATRLTEKAKQTIIASGDFDGVVDKSMESLEFMVLESVEDSIRSQLLKLIAQNDLANPTTPFGPNDHV